MEQWLITIIISVIVVFLAVIAFKMGVAYRKKVAENLLGSAEKEANKILSDVITEAEAKKKSILLEGKDEVHKLRVDTERELSEKRKDIQKQEKRIQQREESIDKKLENIELKNEEINKKSKLIESKLKEADDIKHEQFTVLEKISGFTTTQAK